MNGTTITGSGSGQRRRRGLPANADRRRFDGNGADDILWENARWRALDLFHDGAVSPTQCGARRSDRLGQLSARAISMVTARRPAVAKHRQSNTVLDLPAEWRNRYRRRSRERGSGYAPTQIADFDGDGKADILWEKRYREPRGDFFMNGASLTISAHAAPAPPPAGRSPVPSDFNGDGKCDLLLKNTANPTQLWIYISRVALP